jgi:hypothetical protein
LKIRDWPVVDLRKGDRFVLDGAEHTVEYVHPVLNGRVVVVAERSMGCIEQISFKGSVRLNIERL